MITFQGKLDELQDRLLPLDLEGEWLEEQHWSLAV
jgi:hypothetical protein